MEAPNSNTIEITNSSLYFNWYYLGEAVPNDDTVKGNCYNYTFYENNSINLNKYHENNHFTMAKIMERYTRKQKI